MLDVDTRLIQTVSDGDLEFAKRLGMVLDRRSERVRFPGWVFVGCYDWIEDAAVWGWNGCQPDGGQPR